MLEMVKEDEGKFLLLNGSDQGRLVPQAGVGKLDKLKGLQVEGDAIIRQQSHKLIRQNRAIFCRSFDGFFQEHIFLFWFDAISMGADSCEQTVVCEIGDLNNEKG